MNKWKIKKEIVLFPLNWDKEKVMNWINAKHIRICPICGKIDVSYNHFNIHENNKNRN